MSFRCFLTAGAQGSCARSGAARSMRGAPNWPVQIFEMFQICYHHCKQLIFSLFVFLNYPISTLNLVDYIWYAKMFSLFCLQRTPISHKVIEKRRRDRINRCLNELGKTVPMALAKQVFWSSNVCFAFATHATAAALFYANFHSSHLNTLQNLEQIVYDDQSFSW